MIKNATEKTETVEIIEINWNGPFEINEVITNFTKDYDRGIYQIYGTHNIYGPKTLLYIGKAQDRTFAKRLSEHKDWVEWEPTGVDIYLGKVAGKDKVTESKRESWYNQISRAERLLIFYCSPPYNSYGLNDYGEMPPSIVLNYGKSMRLPYEASNLHHILSTGTPKWKEYEIK